MGFLFGAVCGVAVNVWSNGLRKVPLWSKPWEHVLAFGIGGFAAIKYVEVEDSMRARVEADLQALGRESSLYRKW